MPRFLLITWFTLCFACALSSCGKEEKPATGTGGPAKHSDAASDHSGKVIELGTATIGPYSVRASRDEGAIKSGGDAPIDVWVEGAGTPKVAAVRFWLGTQDAKGSVKARAQIEFPDQPTHWHTHAEVPTPLPAGSQVWVEIEDDKGVKSTGSFGLKM